VHRVKQRADRWARRGEATRRVWELHVAGRRVPRGVVLGPMVAGSSRACTVAYDGVGGAARRSGAPDALAGATSRRVVEPNPFSLV
jgi:hypothetical protein